MHPGTEEHPYLTMYPIPQVVQFVVEEQSKHPSIRLGHAVQPVVLLMCWSI
jgi:hypothetical protein